jgi:hypothetical protein
MLRLFPITVLVAHLGLMTASSSAQTMGRGGVELGVPVETAQRGQAVRPRPNRLWRLPDRRNVSQEPATARGYADGYRRGLEDGRDRDRYDPVGHGDYRSGDPGYSRSYGSRDSYRVNYRAGFRQGYEDGYRDAARGRR